MARPAVLALLGLFLVSAAAASAQSGAEKFRLPSGNI